MAASKVKSFGIDLLESLLLILGATLAFSGWRAVRKRRVTAEGREYQGRAAARLGWLWLILGILLILAAVLDIAFLKSFARLFLESNS
ncbi:MAG: hypothetical protein MUF02_04145 [Acidobacteria bacterium]|jgi:hypothetical protein|nr:hypothetical protein [Acidobacteriota bacterium]